MKTLFVCYRVADWTTRCTSTRPWATSSRAGTSVLAGAFRMLGVSDRPHTRRLVERLSGVVRGLVDKYRTDTTSSDGAGRERQLHARCTPGGSDDEGPIPAVRVSGL